jgi:hypothetical protein
MNVQSEEAIRDLRTRMASESSALKKLEKEFEHPYFKRRVRRAITDCEEAEIMFLRPLEKETWRDLPQELRAIGYANSIFQFAVDQRKQLQQIMEQYGPSATVVP